MVVHRRLSLGLVLLSALLWGGSDALPGTYRETVLADAPAAYWRLGEVSGTVARDESGNGRGAIRPLDE